ncbi:MAG: hypothetical protein GC171_07560 [Terrimonas sp.]|nr:hypothetical protein [Terrimonas sp.]
MIRWKKLFFFCFGLFIASSFAMKWMEPDLVYAGNPISIFGLELFYPSEKIEQIFRGMDEKVAVILSYHLHFDYIFMAGCYPGIASLCMMAREKTARGIFKNILWGAALLQTLAWAFDIAENHYLLKWMDQPQIGDSFTVYHFFVFSKWILALSGVVLAGSILLFSGYRSLQKNANS